MNSVFRLCAFLVFGLVINEPLHPQEKPLPVVTTYRKSFLQGSYVLQIKNTSSESLQLLLQAKGKATSFELSAGKTEEFGWVQGYRFDANNNFLICANGYDTLRQRMPDVELNPVKIDFSREGGLSISLSQSYLQERLPKFLKLPIREKASGSIEIILEEFPQLVLIDGSEKVYANAILQASFLSGRLKIPLAVGVSFVPSYTSATGEVVVTQIQIENIDVNVPGSNIGLLPGDWRAEVTKVINIILPTVFSQLVLYKIEKQWQKNILKAMNFRAKVIDGRLELIVL